MLRRLVNGGNTGSSLISALHECECGPPCSQAGNVFLLAWGLGVPTAPEAGGVPEIEGIHNSNCHAMGGGGDTSLDTRSRG